MEANILTLYNFALGLPPIAIGVFDSDLSRRFMLAHPEMYTTGRTNQDLNNWVMVRWIIKAVFTAVVLDILIFAFASQDGLDGLYVMGTLAYMVLVQCMLYKAALEMSTISLFSVLSIVVSVVGTLCFTLGYSHWAGFAPSYYFVGVMTFNRGMFWLVFFRYAALMIERTTNTREGYRATVCHSFVEGCCRPICLQ
jgi:magnesium-transporting ATPase (P-type)